jgi:hypothetical protein
MARKVIHPKLNPELVRSIYLSRYRKIWLAKYHSLSLDLIKKIKKCCSLEDALRQHGNYFR